MTRHITATPPATDAPIIIPKFLKRTNLMNMIKKRHITATTPATDAPIIILKFLKRTKPMNMIKKRHMTATPPATDPPDNYSQIPETNHV